MNRQMWIIFLMMANFQGLNSQIVDDFSSNDPIIDENWVGDRSKFIINPSNQLQLNDHGGGFASLNQKTNWADSMTWEMYLQLDFSPSNSNRLEIHLWSDHKDWAYGNGYALRLGQNGSDDAIQLMLNEQGRQTEVAAGSLGALAVDPVKLRIKVSVSDGFLVIQADFHGGFCYETEIEALITVPEIGDEIYFGWRAFYTSTRSNKFFFDDIYVGPARIDNTQPRVNKVRVSSNIVLLTFNEPMEVASINSSIIALTPSIALLDIELEKTQLSITSDNFDNETTYSLNLEGLRDLAGNVVDTIIKFIVPRVPKMGDLLINEVLFNPKSTGADYVEIYNNTTGRISLEEVSVSNRFNADVTSLKTLEILDKNEYLVITSDKLNILSSFPSNDPDRVFQLDIPRLNNNDGNVTILLGDVVIDEFDYDENMHQRLIDDVEGVSLERISFNINSNERSNWTSALSSVNYGTPGVMNSTTDMFSGNDNIVELAHKVFSPNGDGDKDAMQVTYSLDAAGYVGTVRIYNERGILINTLMSNEILPANGIIVWTGIDQSGHQATTGLYILHVSLFNLEGSIIEKKLTVGLGDFLN